MRAADPDAAFRSFFMVSIKICGMTNIDDCRAAVDLGVDFIGFVFYGKSVRYISPRSVRENRRKIGWKNNDRRSLRRRD